ncbi:hypothetical protein DFJ74DRAFT_409509 [Hyaloraphidium curvatum]|nr:hypothetical protein DFJ74DRAFT_409509 [Hyaloraphidium curvatum]
MLNRQHGADRARMPVTSSHILLRHARSSYPRFWLSDMDASAVDAPASGPATRFSAAEWAALFPSPVTPGPDAADADVPHELRELALRVAAERAVAPPLDLDALLAGLEGAPVTRQLVRVGAFLKRRGLPHYGLMELTHQAFALFFVLLVWIENDGRFGTRQLVVATVASFVRVAIWDARLMTGHFLPSEKEVFMKPSAADSGSSVDGNVLAGLVRYRELVQAGGTLLTEHVPGDPLCACPKPGCTGGLTWVTFFSYTASAAVQIACMLTWPVVLRVWTPAVTLGSVTWSTPWAATLVVLGIVFISWLMVVTTLMQVATYARNGAAFALDTRLRRRAAQLCLEDLLERLRDALARPDGTWKPREAESEPYMALHGALVTTWRRTKAGSDPSRAVMLTGLLAEVVAVLIFVIGSSCIPSPNLAGVLYIIFTLLVFDLLVLAAANTSPDRIAALFRSASHSLRSIGTAAAASGRTDLAAAASWHDRFLSGFADVDPYRIRAFGAPVTFDLVRTVVATLFTLGVGLWSLLRGAGVGVTIGIVCPVGGCLAGRTGVDRCSQCPA